MYQSKETKKIIQQMVMLFDSPIALLVKESGLSRPTVSKFFNGKEIRPSSTEMLFELCLELVSAKKSKREANLLKEQKISKTLA